MTDTEFTGFNKALLCAFPSVAEWINRNSPDPLATQAAWRQTLRPCRLDECLTIVNEWIEGKRQPPTPYEFHSTALIIRARVMNDRDRDRKKEVQRQNLETYDDHRRAAHEHRNSYVRLTELPGMFGVADAVKRSIVIKKEFLDGKMTEVEYTDRINQLVEHVA